MEPDICLITGANSEIAAAIAKRLLPSYRLFLCWHKEHQRVDELLEFGNVSSFQADLRCEAQVRALMRNIFQTYSKIDLLVNCVGKNSAIPNEEITETVWDDVISSNLKPAYFLCKYYREYRNSGTCGCVIHLSSTAGLRPMPSSPHYIAAKAGLIALSNYYAKIMAPYVRVNTIAPGYVQTERHESPDYDSIRDRIPLKRFAELSEIADTVAYIANCKYITGQTVIVDGGLTG